MFAFLITIHVIACIVLILVILLQAGRGGGLSETFGMGSTSTIFGTSASKFLQKATAICAALFLLTSLSLTVLSSHHSKSLMRVEQLKQVMPDVGKRTLPLPKTDEAPEEAEGPEDIIEEPPLEEGEAKE